MPGFATPSGALALNIDHVRHLYGTGRWPQVLESATSLLTARADCSELHYYAGYAALNLKEFAVCHEHLSEATKLDPDNDLVMYARAGLAYQRGDVDEASDYIDQAISRDTMSASYWVLAGWIAYEGGDDAKASRCARQALEIEPEEDGAYHLLAFVDEETYEEEKARIDLLEEGLQRNPECSSYHNDLGTMHAKGRQDLAEAEKCFRDALRLEPDSKEARYNLFQVHRVRDPFYRALHLPLTVTAKATSFAANNALAQRFPKLSQLFSQALALPGLIVFGLWAVTLWPLIKLYEFVTLAEVRSAVGEPGARSGWFHCWPSICRALVFASAAGLVLVASWTVVHISLLIVS